MTGDGRHWCACVACEVAYWGAKYSIICPDCKALAADSRRAKTAKPADVCTANANLIKAAPALYDEAEKAVAALNAMMNTWLDYHDDRGLTEPVTGASANAYELAIQSRDNLLEIIKLARGEEA